MTEFSKVPYLKLTAAGVALPGRITAAEYAAGLKEPRALARLDFADAGGEIRAALAKGTAVALTGGRLGGGEVPVLTGTVSREATPLPGNPGTVRVEVSDPWAASDAVRETGPQKKATPQSLIALLLNKAGLTVASMTARTFRPQPRVPLDGWNLAKTVREAARIWGLDNADAKARKELGLDVVEWNWVARFNGAGGFIYENWPDGPQAAAPALGLNTGELVSLETEETKKGPAGRLELFFDTRIVPGVKLALPNVPGAVRATEVKHRYDGERFRTEVAYGPVGA